MGINNLILKNYFEGRDNLKNKPSLSRRTIFVIDYVMEELELPAGKAMEKLMSDEKLYSDVIEKLKEEYPDIEE
jgi:hypothetical protein